MAQSDNGPVALDRSERPVVRRHRHFRAIGGYGVHPLSDGGVELLGQRRGLNAYMTTGKTMGIPILYPWANRLSANGYGVDGGAGDTDPGVGGVRSTSTACDPRCAGCLSRLAGQAERRQ